MTTDARIGYGRLLSIRDDDLSPPAFVVVGEISAVNGPAFAADAHDATHMQSEDRFREFIPGLRDAGEISGEINYVPGGAGTELMVSNLGRKKTFQIEEPDSGSPPITMVSEAFITAFNITGPVAEKMNATFTLKLSGKPTISGLSFV
jgi:hypothetical protein